jgi:hypothetical protein
MTPLIRIVLLAAVLPLAAPGQWLNYKTPGIPRTTDGKPDLSAPAPRMPGGKPDFSGSWQGSATGKSLEAVRLTPWAEALHERYLENLYRDDPSVSCLPAGPALGLGKVVQTPNLLLMLFEGTSYREVFLDGRDLPNNPNPDWMGYSVGHWEGDTLVIVTAGFNDRTWLDSGGHPHTEALRMTERLHRPDFGHTEVDKTFVDPGALKEPWTLHYNYVLDADNEPLEYVCNENERDHVHMVGTASDAKGVDVAPAVLARYAGTYEFTNPTVRLTFAVVDGRLVMMSPGPATPLTPTSEREFFVPGGSVLEFVSTGNGPATKLIDHVAGQEREGVRK